MDRRDPARAAGYVAAPAALLAFVAWQSGDGALANVALDRALADDPRYSMALLLRQVITAGAPPSLARLPMTPEEVAASYDEAEAEAETARTTTAWTTTATTTNWTSTSTTWTRTTNCEVRGRPGSAAMRQARRSEYTVARRSPSSVCIVPVYPSPAVSPIGERP